MVAQTSSPLNLNLQQLAYLRAIDAEGTLTRAAAELGVSQPALSQAVAEMERRLGVVLLERAGRRRVFTPAGRMVLAFASEALGLAGALERSLAAQRAGGAGDLRVGMIDAASLYLLPPAIQAFRAASPDVRLDLVVDASDPLLARLAAHDLDLAFVVGPLPDALDGEVVQREPLYIYGPPDGVDVAAPADWLLYPTGSRTRTLVDAGLARLGVAPRVTGESNNPEVLRQMVALGLGRSVLPPGVAEAGANPLTREPGDAVAARTLVAAWRPSARPTGAAAALLAAVRGEQAPATPGP